MADLNERGDWGTYRRLVLSELERLVQEIRNLSEEDDRLRENFRSHVDAVQERLFRETQAGLKRHGEDTQKLREELIVLKTTLQLKSGVWGALAGLIPAVGAVLYIILTSR